MSVATLESLMLPASSVLTRRQSLRRNRRTWHAFDEVAHEVLLQHLAHRAVTKLPAPRLDGPSDIEKVAAVLAGIRLCLLGSRNGKPDDCHTRHGAWSPQVYNADHDAEHC